MDEKKLESKTTSLAEDACCCGFLVVFLVAIALLKALDTIAAPHVMHTGPCKTVDFDTAPFWFVEVGESKVEITTCGIDALNAVIRASRSLATSPMRVIAGKYLDRIHLGYMKQKPSAYLICESELKRCEIRGHQLYFVSVNGTCRRYFYTLVEAYDYAYLGYDLGNSTVGYVQPQIRIDTFEMTMLTAPWYRCADRTLNPVLFSDV